MRVQGVGIMCQTVENVVPDLETKCKAERSSLKATSEQVALEEKSNGG